MINKSILFVDDEMNILKAIKRGLIDTDYKCFFAISGVEALEIMEKNEIGVIVTDMRMPDMNGLELLKIVKGKYPKTVKVVLSGYAQLPQVIATINQVDIFKFILKPWDMDNDFLEIIEKGLEYYNFLKEKDALNLAMEKRYNLYLNVLKSTDDKFLRYDRQFENIKSVSTQILELVSGYALDSKDDDIINKIKVIKETYSHYLNAINSTETFFTPHNLSNMLNSLLADCGNKSKSNIYSNKIDDAKIEGNFMLVSVVLLAIIKISFYCKIVNDLSIKLDMRKDSFIVDLNGYYNFENNIFPGSEKIDRTLDEILSIIYIICSDMNCEIIKQETVESINIKLILKQ